MQLEEILGQYYPILDEGFVSLQGVFGGDADIEQFARVSYRKGTRKTSDTRSLIRYLIANAHWSPVEAVEFKFHFRMPLFVVQQLLRHRTANINQESARYSVLEDRYYVPERERIQQQSTTNKQGSGEALSPDRQDDLRQLIWMASEGSFGAYNELLGSNVARETARLVLPVNTYTNLYWKCDLRNLLNFLTLRCDPHAQWEIRAYAEVMARMVELACPIVYEAWIDYQYQATTLSRDEMNLLLSGWTSLNDQNIAIDVSLWKYQLIQDGTATEKEFERLLQKLRGRRNDIPELNPALFRTPEQQEHFDTYGQQLVGEEYHQ